MSDIVIEFIFEFFIESLIDLMANAYESVFPKRVAPKQKIKVICAGIAIVCLVVLVIGGVILAETKGESTLGKTMVISSLLYIVLGIALKIKSVIKSKKSNFKTLCKEICILFTLF